jgi:hypothetical protein
MAASTTETMEAINLAAQIGQFVENQPALLVFNVCVLLARGALQQSGYGHEVAEQFWSLMEEFVHRVDGN